MSTWDREIAATAEAFADLLTEPGRRFDIDVAITARAAVLECVSTVLGDIAPRIRQPVWGGRGGPSLALVVADPLRALDEILRHRPRLELARSPSELLDYSRRPRGSTAAWSSAGRHALLASRAWSTDAPHVLPAERAWQVVSEVAALAEAIGQLDPDLVAQAGSRPDVAHVLTRAGGLRLVAREVATLATRGEHGAPHVGPALADRPTMRVHPGPIRGASPTSVAELDIAAQTRRLTSLLAAANYLTPPHVRGTAAVARDLTVLAGAHAARSGEGDSSQVLAGLAVHLHAAADSHHGEQAIVGGRNPALELQLRELRQCTRVALAADREPAGTSRLVRRLPPLVDLLARQAKIQIVEQRWAIPNRAGGARLPYTYASTLDPLRCPPILTHLQSAGSVAAALRADQVTPSPMPAAAAIACASLRSGFQERERDGRRPQHPAHPPPPTGGHALGL
ncbi:MAG: hypothetical protein ACT4P1_10785 [Sporichthyaceae bacterium]